MPLGRGRRWAFQVLITLSHAYHYAGISHTCLRLEDVRLARDGDVRLYGWDRLVYLSEEPLTTTDEHNADRSPPELSRHSAAAHRVKKESVIVWRFGNFLYEYYCREPVRVADWLDREVRLYFATDRDEGVAWMDEPDVSAQVSKPTSRQRFETKCLPSCNV